MPGPFLPSVEQSLCRRATSAFNHQNRFIREALRAAETKRRASLNCSRRAGWRWFYCRVPDSQAIHQRDIQAVAERNKVGKAHLTLLPQSRMVLETAADCEINASLPV